MRYPLLWGNTTLPKHKTGDSDNSDPNYSMHLSTSYYFFKLGFVTNVSKKSSNIIKPL